MGLLDMANGFADDHDKQVDEGIEKAGEQVDQRGGGNGVDEAQQHTGGGDTQQ